MPAGNSFSPELVWTLFGSIGAIIFYGRFYVQWIVSERRKRSVIPLAFWYMSGAGSIMQFIYAVHLVSPGAAFGQCFNLIVYTRNLIHIWRERGRLTTALNAATHGLAVVVTLFAVVFMARTWLWEYHANQAVDPHQAAQNWFWLGIWGAGQVMFFLRFFVQWLATEWKKKSVVPPAFWYLSIGGAMLQMGSFIQRADWIFAIGMAATIFIYVRNILLIKASAGMEEAAEEVSR